MSTEPPKSPDSPFKLNTGRIVLLALGALLLVYIVAAFSGSLTNYQLVKEGAQSQKATPDVTTPQTPTPATPATPAPAN